MARLTIADLVAKQDQDRAESNAKFDAVLALLQGQHATPAPVAEATSKPKKSTKAKVEPVVVKSQSDLAREHAEANGLAFARGGRTTGDVEVARAIVRVLKNGTPEIVLFDGIGNLDKRHIVGVSIFRTEDGKGYHTQYLFRPEA